jgi:hypothetical protein
VLWHADEHEQLTDRPWSEGRVRDALSEIVTDAEISCVGGFWPGHPLDDLSERARLCSIYLGSAGMIWALRDLESSFDGREWIAALIEHYRASPDFDEQRHPPSLLMGETGLLVVAAKVGSPLADPQRLRELVRANCEHPSWELMWGSPGTMLAARAFGLQEEWRESAQLLFERWDEDTGVWTQTLYGRVVEILGPPHGFAGNVHALRGYVDDECLRQRVAYALERTAMHEDGLVNWPPVTPATQRSDRIRVQWCHGAPGIVVTLGDVMPVDLALGGGELTWQAGPLRKGPGLCHGTAGNGFTFLKLLELTGDERWLDRARRFAMHAIEQVELERGRLGRGRYTLLTGDIGVALYLRACLDANPAMPTMDYL